MVRVKGDGRWKTEDGVEEKIYSEETYQDAISVFNRKIIQDLHRMEMQWQFCKIN